MTKNVLNKLGFLGAVFVAAVGFPLIFASSASAQLAAPAVPDNPAAPAPQAEVERVIVTGSNIPTAEETGPEPGGYIPAAGHRETGYPQRHGPHYLYSARSWRHR